MCIGDNILRKCQFFKNFLNDWRYVICYLWYQHKLVNFKAKAGTKKVNLSY